MSNPCDFRTLLKTITSFIGNRQKYSFFEAVIPPCTAIKVPIEIFHWHAFCAQYGFEKMKGYI